MAIATLRTPPTIVNSNNLALLGDSITARWRSGTDGVGSGQFTQAWGYIKWALELSNQRYTVVDSSATSSSGCTSFSSTIHPTFQEQAASILTSTSTDVMVLGAINDIQADAPLALVISSMLAILDSLVATGRKIYLCTIPPLNSTYGNYTAARQGTVLAYNAWIKALCTSNGYKGLRLVDMYAVAVDSASLTGDFKTNYAFDGIHPRNLCAYYMGKELARVWASDGAAEQPMLLAAGADAQVDHAGATLFASSTNILQNGCFNLGAPTAGLAQTWTIANGGTATNTTSIVAGTVGNIQRVMCTFVATGDIVTLESANFAARAPLTSKLLAAVAITVSSPVNLRNVRFRLRGFGNVNPTFNWSQADSNDIALPEGWTGVLRADLDLSKWPLTVLGGGLRLAVIAEANGAGSCTLDVSQASVRLL